MRKLITVLTAFTMLTLSYAGDGKLGGLVFYDYSYDLTEDAEDLNSFALHRVYLTYKQAISDGVSYKFQADIDYKNSPKNLYLKNAKVDWKSPLGKFTIGLQGMNVFNVAEKTWGFRFIEKSPMDAHKFSSSADMGIGYNGKLKNLNYNLMITNGTGYKKSEDDKYKKISAQLIYGEKKLVKKDGYNVGLSVTMEPYEIDSVTTENKTVVALYGGYAASRLRIGAEYDMYTDAGSDVTKQIIAFYTSCRLTDNLEGLVYYDMYDPNTNVDKDGKTYIIAGVNYSPGDGLIITPNIRMTTPEEGDKTTIFKVNFQFKF